MSRRTKVELRTVAVIEAAKAAIVLITGLGFASLMHHDAQRVAELLVHHLHLNPAKGYPKIFVDAAAQMNDSRLMLLAAAAAGYTALRLAEAYGLWNGRAWAEWLAAVSGAIYLPFEIIELSRGITPLRLATFMCNLLVVGLMVAALLERRREQGHIT
jgi:uncharacterized membrane protein (DUF2068 family)